MPGDQQTQFRIDLSDPTFRELSKSAGRVAALLRSQKAKSSPELLASLDDFLGCVYALIFAKQCGFANRTAVPIEVDKVVKRADQLAIGDVRTDGKWMAGFHFNSALFRTAAVYHRALKVVVGKPGSKEYAPKLQPDAAKLYRQWKHRDWQSGRIKTVYEQVNELKHTPKGVYEGRTAGYQDAVLAVGELLELIEAWAAQP